MCGIVGYVGERDCTEVLLDALSKLEYRGYDSAGIAVFEKDRIMVEKSKGELKNLREKINKEHKPDGHCGIGHTRWATHGEPSDINSHPHGSKRVSIVHNGIIENYKDIKNFLIGKGYTFISETDTETVAKLLDYYYEGDPVEAIIKTLNDIRGAYALGILFKDFPDRIFAVRKDSPLIIGVGEEENFIASDVPAILKYTRKYYLLEENEIATIKSDRIEFCNIHREPITKEVQVSNLDMDAAEKGGYEHFMLKEIHEQPTAVKTTISPRINNGMPDLSECGLTPEMLKNYRKFFIVACGTAMHAGMVGKYVIEKLARTEVTVDIASEFRYRDPLIDEHTLFIAISQSGETLDTLAALREAKRKGARVLSVVNVVGSSVARESDDVFYTWAGPEIAVASTKAYTTQLMCMYLLALHMGQVRGTIDDAYFETVMNQLKALPEKLERVLEQEEHIAQIAEKIYRNNNVFFIGRGMDASIAYEGSLKLKEISYINSFAMAAGELKHGTIALIEPGTLVIALAAQEKLYEKMLSNIQEIKARGALVIGVAKDNSDAIEKQSDMTIYIPDCIDEVSPVLEIVPLQILAYHIARLRGCNIDKPKNLAKSVTVE